MDIAIKLVQLMKHEYEFNKDKTLIHIFLTHCAKLKYENISIFPNLFELTSEGLTCPILEEEYDKLEYSKEDPFLADFEYILVAFDKVLNSSKLEESELISNLKKEFALDNQICDDYFIIKNFLLDNYSKSIFDEYVTYKSYKMSNEEFSKIEKNLSVILKDYDEETCTRINNKAMEKIKEMKKLINN